MVEYSIQTNHLHLIVEGSDRTGVARGVAGLCIRIARGLNRLWCRRGAVFADRYHDVVLRNPRQVRNALLYVLQNARKHGTRFARTDPFSSGPSFRGWARLSPGNPDPRGPRARAPTAAARTWLLSRGWLRHGRLTWSGSPRAGR